MAKTFTYNARDRQGQLITGTILADNEAAVAGFIRTKGYYVTGIREKREPFSLTSFLSRLQSVSTKDLAILCRQFATMIDAGLSLTACLSILIDQTLNPQLKVCLGDVSKNVQEGRSLSKSLAQHSRIFPSIMVSMIEAGELGGVLDTVMNRLALHFEKEHKLNEKVRSALTYPAVVIFMAILSLTFIVTFVLPTFMQLYGNMKVELPLPTRILLAISDMLRNYGLWILALFAAASAGMAWYAQRPAVKAILDRMVLRMPIFGLLLRKIAIARFSRTLSTLVRGGVSLIAAMEVVKNTTTNLAMIDALAQAQNSIREGQGLAAPLGGSKVFTPMVVQMIAVGEETGELDKMLEKIADFYDSDVDDMVGRLSTLLEPILIGVLGVVIGLIVISVVLPLFDIVTHFNQGV